MEDTISIAQLQLFFEWFDGDIYSLNSCHYSYKYPNLEFGNIKKLFNYWKVNIAPEAISNNK